MKALYQTPCTTLHSDDFRLDVQLETPEINVIFGRKLLLIDELPDIVTHPRSGLQGPTLARLFAFFVIF